MHGEALAFMVRAVGELGPFERVVEFGSRNINGSVRPLFESPQRPVDYVGVDLEPGEGVDVIADARHHMVGTDWDAVVCCEVLEHAEDWRDLIWAARIALKPGAGVLFITCATYPRAAHSATDGGELRPGEYYGNVPGEALVETFWRFGLALERYERHEARGDLYAVARRMS